VRELENLLERIFILEDDDVILPRHLPDRIIRTVRAGSATVPPAPTDEGSDGALQLGFHAATEAYQKELIENALAASRNNLKDTAALLKISRHALRHQMIKLGMISA
jgi:two-component system response regulator AtoC